MYFKFLVSVLLMSTFYSSTTLGQKSKVTENQFITVDGVQLHYRSGGSGPVLLLLHGFTLSSDQWTPFYNELAEKYTVISMDMPGHGKSGYLGEPFSFERWAKLMLKMLGQMEIDNIYAAGHSAGAITLMHMALQDPEIIESMILISGGHRYNEEARKDLRYDSFEKASKGLQQYYMNIHYADTAKITALFEDIHYMADQIPVALDKAVLNPESLAKITMPVLLVWGDRDFYFPVKIAVELYQLLPDAQLWIVPGEGHTPIWSFMGGDAFAESVFIVRASNIFSEKLVSSRKE